MRMISGRALIFQGMDAAGKDGAIKHVMESTRRDASACLQRRRMKELHDFPLARAQGYAGSGKIGIFTGRITRGAVVECIHRSLKVRSLPTELITKHIWGERYEDNRTASRNS